MKYNMNEYTITVHPENKWKAIFQTIFCGIAFLALISEVIIFWGMYA